MELHLARTPPQVFAHKGTTINFFHLRENPVFEQNFFKTPYVSNECIYRPNILGRKHPLPKVSFDIIFGQKNFRKILHLNPKGKVVLGVILGRFFKRKNFFSKSIGDIIQAS